MADRPDPARQRGDGGLVGDVHLLNVNVPAGIRARQIVRATSGGDNPASLFADGQGNRPRDPAAAADDQHSSVFQ
jgi:hypothetical protein